MSAPPGQPGVERLRYRLGGPQHQPKCGDCWSLLLIGALTTCSSDRRVLGSFLEIQEGQASVFGHQLLEYHLVEVTHWYGA